MSSYEIRNTFLTYFKEREHQVLESAPLIPDNDPTLLWINAGVTPLKKYFDGSVVPENRRMTSCQKCIRTNDIENVGKTARHQTFFEMLGNFSVGDYFKEEALGYSLELLTSEKYFGLEKDKLYMTIYPNDCEAYNRWIELGVDPSHIIKLEDNFWEIGPGPCGPDSEVFYDRGEQYDPEHRGIELLEKDIENDRYIEIWNNVFSQFNAKKGVKREDYKELPSKNIDTGMGLERMACILQDTETNFETDLFMPLINTIEELSDQTYETGDKEAFKVIADHIRTICFALSDGATFSNVGRGYILRRLLRRAVRYGKKLGIEKPFMDLLVRVNAENMKDHYPYLIDKIDMVEMLVRKEEELFNRTLVDGEKHLMEYFKTHPDKNMTGEAAFKLYDTYGFPFELTEEYAKEQGFSVSKEEFEKYMAHQKEVARTNRKVDASMNQQNKALLKFKNPSEFIGYDQSEVTTKINGLFQDGNPVDTLVGDGYIALEQTPFYATMGGQVSDTGTIIAGSTILKVDDVIKAPNKQHLHHVIADAKVQVGDTVIAHIDEDRRQEIEANHSATHLLQAALREVLNDNVTQAGSRVDEDSLRFDFVYPGSIEEADLIKIEEVVNEQIQAALETKVEYMDLKEAIRKNAIALFSDKYGKEVRVVTIGNSMELCGGTHVKNTKDIERFAICDLENKGASVYRIVATTRNNIEHVMQQNIHAYNEEMRKALMKAKNILTTAEEKGIKLQFHVDINNDQPMSYKDIVANHDEMQKVKNTVNQLEETYFELLEKQTLSNLNTYLEEIEIQADYESLVLEVEDQNVKVLKQLIDTLVDRMNDGIVFLANKQKDNITYLCKADKNLSDRFDCGQIVRDIATKTGGNGGGSKTFAQGGGTDFDALQNALEDVKQLVRSQN